MWEKQRLRSPIKKCVINSEPIPEEFFSEEDRDKDKCNPSRTLRYSSFLFSYDEELDSEYQYFSYPNLGGYQYANFCPLAFGEIFYKDDDKEDDYFPGSCQVGTLSNNYGEKIGNKSFCFIRSLFLSKQLLKFVFH